MKLTILRVSGKCYSTITEKTVESLNYTNTKGKAIFKELLDELRLTYELVEFGYAKWVKRAFCHDKPEHNKDVMAFQKELITDDRTLRLFLTETAYTIFFYGKQYFSIEMTKNNPRKVVTMEQIYKIVSEIKGSISENVARSFGIHTVSNGVASYIYHAPQSVLKGESYQLAQYFRVLFSLVNYIDKADVKGINYNEKYEYIKLLRCQMSDEEQALLFYNSISPMGLKWNAKKDDAPLSIDSMGLIARYKLVKNLPPRFFFFGINPMEYYAAETKYYEEIGKRFYEHESFYKYDSQIYVEKKMDRINEESHLVIHFKYL